MAAIRANIGPAYWRTGSFRPEGRLRHVGTRSNPREWASSTTWAARLFVGLSVGEEPRYSVDDVIAIVLRERAAHPDSSYVAQKGVYTSKEGGYRVVEDGVQVVIVSTDGQAPKAFQADMERLAEAVCRELEQERVILEIQRNGVVKTTISIVP